MNILIDTHIAVWAATDDPRLSKKARDLLLNPGNNIYFSSVSAMEISIKRKSKNKKKADELHVTTEEFVNDCRESGYIELPLNSSHIVAEEALKWGGDGDEHRDPFDRLLLAQAKVEKYSFMTHDHMIPMFDEKGIIKV